jgi:GNAT superfamily N-acetyltransferase
MAAVREVRIRRGGVGDVRALAALRWSWARERGSAPTDEGFDAFAASFGRWLRGAAGHHPVLGLCGEDAIGMGWLAVVERVPDVDRPVRQAGLVQSTVVLPEHRARGIGARIVAEIVDHARELDLDYLEVHPSERSYPFYRRLGFGGDGPTLRLPLRSGR